MSLYNNVMVKQPQKNPCIYLILRSKEKYRNYYVSLNS